MSWDQHFPDFFTNIVSHFGHLFNIKNGETHSPAVAFSIIRLQRFSTPIGICSNTVVEVSWFRNVLHDTCAVGRWREDRRTRRGIGLGVFVPPVIKQNSRVSGLDISRNGHFVPRGSPLSS